MSLVLFDLVTDGTSNIPDVSAYMGYRSCLHSVFVYNLLFNIKCDSNRLKYMRLLSLLKNRRIEMVTSLG